MDTCDTYSIVSNHTKICLLCYLLTKNGEADTENQLKIREAILLILGKLKIREAIFILGWGLGRWHRMAYTRSFQE